MKKKTFHKDVFSFCMNAPADADASASAAVDELADDTANEETEDLL